MIDPALAIMTWLQSDSALVALVDSGNVCSPVLPEGFSALAESGAPGPINRAVVIRKAGGKSQSEIPPVLDPRFAIECWALESTDAQQVYGIVRDLLHGANSIDLGTAGFIISSQEEVPGQDVVDPETHWFFVVSYFNVMMRSSVALPVPPNLTEAFGPPGALGHNGDLYLDLLTGDLYEQILGAWVLVGNVPQGGSTEMPSLIYHKVADSGTNAAAIKNAPGVVTGWKIYNNAQYPIYVKLYDQVGAPTPGVDVPKQTIGVEAGLGEVSNSAGFTYSTGIAISIGKGIADDDSSAVAAGDCVVDLFYQ